MNKDEIKLLLAKISSTAIICRKLYNGDRDYSPKDLLSFATEANDAIAVVSEYACGNAYSSSTERRELSKTIYDCLKHNIPMHYFLWVIDSLPCLKILLDNINEIGKETVQRLEYRFENQSEESVSKEIKANVKNVDSLKAEVKRLEQENEELRACKDNKQADTAPLNARIAELEAEVENLKEELAAYKERNQNRRGINQLQTAYLGMKLAPKLGINVTDKKALAPALSKLFGWGERKLEQEMSKYLSEEKELELADIFGQLSPELAKYICAKWEGTPSGNRGTPK